MEQTKPLFVVNPIAGQGRARRVMPRILAAAPGPAEVATSSSPGDAEEIAFQGAMARYDPIVAVGGDGTLQEVVNGVMRSQRRPAIGIVPAGSGNDLARSLRLPADPAELARGLWSGVSGEIDMAMCNGRYFLNVGGVGLDTEVAMAVNRRSGRFSSGRLPYILHGIAELSRYRNPEFSLQLDDQVMSISSTLVVVANARFFAGGMMICPDADLTDGLLDVCLAGDLTRMEALTLLPRLFYGGHVHHPKVSFHKVSRVRIDASQGLEVQLDGEVIGALPAEFRVDRRALRVAGWEPAMMRKGKRLVS
jgi:diacylglycerol kinase (ATP)